MEFWHSTGLNMNRRNMLGLLAFLPFCKIAKGAASLASAIPAAALDWAKAGVPFEDWSSADPVFSNGCWYIDGPPIDDKSLHHAFQGNSIPMWELRDGRAYVVDNDKCVASWKARDNAKVGISIIGNEVSWYLDDVLRYRRCGVYSFVSYDVNYEKAHD